MTKQIYQDPGEEKIGEALHELQAQIFSTAQEKGWWEKERNFGEAVALMHSELSEALEAHRHGNPPSDKIPEFSGVEEEFADEIIRILDIAAGFDLNVIGAIFAKIRFNQSRPYKHGKAY